MDTYTDDEARLYCPDGLVVVSRGIAAKPADEVANILMRVRTFDEFTPHNDPYGEHYGSPDPADPRLTKRVLTVMLADEY